jgi:hypothetical protein
MRFPLDRSPSLSRHRVSDGEDCRTTRVSPHLGTGHSSPALFPRINFFFFFSTRIYTHTRISSSSIASEGACYFYLYSILVQRTTVSGRQLGQPHLAYRRRQASCHPLYARFSAHLTTSRSQKRHVRMLEDKTFPGHSKKLDSATRAATHRQPDACGIVDDRGGIPGAQRNLPYRDGRRQRHIMRDASSAPHRGSADRVTDDRRAAPASGPERCRPRRPGPARVVGRPPSGDDTP